MYINARTVALQLAKFFRFSFILSHYTIVNQISLLFLVFPYFGVNKIRDLWIKIHYATGIHGLTT